MNVMISSMETITKTMLEIQHKSETFDEAENTHGTAEKQTLSNVSRLAIMPFFEMSKLPMNVFASVMKTISKTQQEIKEQTAADNGANSEKAPETYDREIASFTAQEAALETKATLANEIEEMSERTLWQIGRSGRSDFQKTWTSTFDYHVGTDIDPINSPGIPHFITVHGGEKSKGATEKLNIHFTLDRDYPDGELAFIYDRWGAEKDQVLVDGQLLAPISGAGKGKFKHVALSLKDILKGNHVITLTTSGNPETGGHRFDYFQLAAIRKPTARG